MKHPLSIRYLTLLFLLACICGEVYALEEIQEDTILSNLAFEYGSKGYYNLEYDRNLDTAEYYLKKALELQYSISNYEINERVAINHVSLASVYRLIYNNKEAIANLNEAEKILNNNNDTDNLLFGNIYHNKGNLYRVTNDVYRTKEYYEYALDFVDKIGYQNTTYFSHIFSNYINLLFELGEYDLAEEQLSLIDINSLKVSPQTELRIHLTNAYAYSKLNNYESSVFHLEKAYEIIKKHKNQDFISLKVAYYIQSIDFHILYSEYNEALRECDQAFSFIETLDPSSTKNKTNFQSFITYRIATIHYRQGNLGKALRLVNGAIDKLNEFFIELSVSDAVANVNNESSSVITELYVLKSRILFETYRESYAIEDLKSCHEAFKKAIQRLNSSKLAMQNEDSRIYATSQILEIYNEATYVGKLLYDMTGEISYLEESFEFAESSKSFALYSEIKDIEAMEFSGLPSEIKVKEEQFLANIQGYEKLLYDEQLSDEPDITQIELYKEKLFHLKDDYDDLMKEIERNYSKYYEFKYKPTFVTLADVQEKLPYKEALIEYVLTDTMLITYVIDRKGINVFSQDISPEFADECIEYYQLLYKQNFSNGVHDNYRRFVTLGRKFYNILIEPCLQYTDKKSFTIVLDGAITYLPFEAFLTKDTDTEYIDYMVLPYMIRDFSIGYSHSSTLMFSKRLKTKSPEKKVLAFAPKYTNALYDSPAYDIRQALPEDDYLMPLGGIIKEVQSINETVPSKVFINENATEANFKKFASDYNVLHLAMHTIMRDDEPLYSYLAFTNVDTGDTIEDNKLYAYEIYNMKLNAQMAVLSSCSSGFGKMQKGEGMMSLARGFIYAGCPSIIMTLWQVSDQSSSELMTSFYKYLKKGKSKQEAMRLSKIDYLDTADDLTSNPYFWSSFVVVGDGSPIYRKSGIAYWMIIISVFIGALVFFQYKRS